VTTNWTGKLAAGFPVWSMALTVSVSGEPRTCGIPGGGAPVIVRYPACGGARFVVKALEIGP
jgi:hypothetical protein